MDAHKDWSLNDDPEDSSIQPRPMLSIRSVSKTFASVRALENISIDVPRGAFFCLVGPSGCGKTTLLRIAGGHERPDEGQVFVDGNDVTDSPPYARPTNMVFQSYALFPHLSAERNIAFGLEEERLPRDEIFKRVERALALLDMQEFCERKPAQLSGGQQQRTALARAIVKQPKILLLDEPLAALDKTLREQAQVQLIELRKRLGITFITVTHDLEEAMGMASHIAVMRSGAIVQTGAADELYNKPNSRYVADFFGRANFFVGRLMETSAGIAKIKSDDDGCILAASAEGLSSGVQQLLIMVRPEQIVLKEATVLHTDDLVATVKKVSFFGAYYMIELTCAKGKSVNARLPPSDPIIPALTLGASVHVSWLPKAARILPV